MGGGEAGSGPGTGPGTGPGEGEGERLRRRAGPGPEAGGWRLDKSRTRNRTRPGCEAGYARPATTRSGRSGPRTISPTRGWVLSREPASVAAVGPRVVVMPACLCARGGGPSQHREILLQRPDGPMAGRRWARDTRPQVFRAWQRGHVLQCTAGLSRSRICCSTCGRFID